MRPYLLLIAFCCISFPSIAQENNDTIGKDLQEITVNADMQKISAQSATYYPSSKVKKSADNAIDLLKRMAIPQIFIHPVTNAITNSGGNDVQIFINYIKASESDIYGLRTQDVKRVEILDFPSDPRFQGSKNVINIIIQEYEYGGYTKISDSQTLISEINNRGSVFSRFAFKQMSYDLYVGPQYTLNNHNGYSSESLFHLEDESVERNEDIISGKRENISLPVSFRAIYDNKNIQIANTVGFSFGNTGVNSTSGKLSFIPDRNSDGYSYEKSSPSTDRSLIWTGGYYFVFPKNWSLYIVPSASYSHNNYFSNYSTSVPGEAPIINNAREDAYNFRLSSSVYKMLNQSNSIDLTLAASSTKNDIDYFGSSPSVTDHSATDYTVALTYSYYKDSRFYLTLYGGFGGNKTTTNGATTSQCYPFADLNVSYSPNTKSSLQFTAATQSITPAGASRETNIFRINEFLFQTGNPYLKNFQSLKLNINYTFFPCNEFIFQAYARYSGSYNRFINTYTPYENGKYIITSSVNSGDFNRITAGANLTGRLLSNSLVLQVSPSVSRMVSSGYQSMSHNYFDWSINAQYYFGNFNISALYASKSYEMGALTGDETRTPSYYSLRIGWAKNSWNLSLNAKNVFRNDYFAQKVFLSTPDYENIQDFRLPSYHAALEISASYTFGYGKKVASRNEIGEQWGASSAILK
ncbi:MAG: outer membrane beta-barrel family protein [Muribaculaceae bacterium]|nr:outer membrane beta-barrel family protein [Muribaculaceae bacterium]